MTAPIDWQYQLAGVYFNTGDEPDENGCLYAMPTPQGWEGAIFRGTSTPIPFADGANISDSYLGARMIHGVGQITGPDAESIELAKQKLAGVCNSLLRADGLFVARLDTGMDVYCTVRLGGQLALDDRYGPESVSFDFLVQAGDPRKYSMVPIVATINSSTVVGGASYPISYPLLYAADTDVVTPTGTSTNAGNADAPFIATFNGPLNNPQLIDRLGQQRIPLNFDLPAGQSIVVDTLNETITLAGDDAYTAFDDINGTPLDELRVPAKGECDWLLLGQGSGNCVITSHDTFG